jgi:hypothetical protein
MYKNSVYCGDGGTPIQETPWGPLIGKQSY